MGLGGLSVVGGVDPQPLAPVDELSGAELGEPLVQRRRAGDHQGVQLTLRGASGLDRRSAGGQPRCEGRADPALLGCRRVWGCERFACGSQRVDGVGLGAVAPCGTAGPFDLCHQLAVCDEPASQPGAVTACAFDRPHSRAVGDPLKQRREVLGVVSDLQHVALAAGARLDHRGGVGVLVGINADDELDGGGALAVHHLLLDRSGGSRPVRAGSTAGL